MLSRDFIEVKTNIEIIARSRGKIVDRRESHNIFVDSGRQWIALYVGGEHAYHIEYMGLGIGGSKQTYAQVDDPPLTDYIPTGDDSRTQTDTNPSVFRIQRPIAITSGVWLKQCVPTHPDNLGTNRVRFVTVFTEQEINFGQYATMPLSEAGLFTGDKVVTSFNNSLIAYDTFNIISKTTALELEMRWTLIF
jgi:hypothetical protein